MASGHHQQSQRSADRPLIPRSSPLSQLEHELRDLSAHQASRNPSVDSHRPPQDDRVARHQSRSARSRSQRTSDGQAVRDATQSANLSLRDPVRNQSSTLNNGRQMPSGGGSVASREGSVPLRVIPVTSGQRTARRRESLASSTESPSTYRRNSDRPGDSPAGPGEIGGSPTRSIASMTRGVIATAGSSRNPVIRVSSPEGRSRPARTDSTQDSHSRDHPLRNAQSAPRNSQQRHGHRLRDHDVSSRDSARVARRNAGNVSLHPEMLQITSAGEAENLDAPPPEYTNPRFSVYTKPLPTATEIRPDQIFFEVPGFVKEYVSRKAFTCVCGMYWVKSAVCHHWYTAHPVYCGGATRDGVSYYCNPRRVVHFQVHCLLIKMACKSCRRQNGRDMTREVETDSPVELFRVLGN